MIRIVFRLIAVVAIEAVLIAVDYGSGYGSEAVVFAVIPIGALAVSWWILYRKAKLGIWSAGALSVATALLGNWLGMVIALNTWGS